MVDRPRRAGLAKTGALLSTPARDLVTVVSTTNLTPNSPAAYDLSQNVVAESILAGDAWTSRPPIDQLFQAALGATDETIFNLFSWPRSLWSGMGRLFCRPIDKVTAIKRRHGRHVARKD